MLNERTQNGVRAFRASVLHFLRDPGREVDPGSFEFFEDGLLVVRDGRIETLGDAKTLLRQMSGDVVVHDYSGRLIVPGLIDTHIHYVQTDVIATYGEDLLDWLENSTFPAERAFEDPVHAEEVAEFFLNELLVNGTTTAAVFGSVHSGSVDAIFSAAQKKRMRMVAGKVLMDRNSPQYLQDSAESGYSDSKGLIEKWHGTGRLLYAVTPRFAPTSSEEQLARAGQLLKEHPDVFLQTHVAENQAEIEWVAKLFPWSRSYLDVYDRYGLLRERSVFAHCIHLDDADRTRMADTGAAASFCPTSNLFLGSGLFDLIKTREQGVRVGIGTDVGGGTSFNLLRTLSEAYKVAQMLGESVSVLRLFYLATLGAAESLYLDREIGNFEIGKEADFVVLNLDSTALIERRAHRTKNLSEKLFILMMLGDDRSVSATFILGEQA